MHACFSVITEDSKPKPHHLLLYRTTVKFNRHSQMSNNITHGDFEYSDCLNMFQCLFHIILSQSRIYLLSIMMVQCMHNILSDYVVWCVQCYCIVMLTSEWVTAYWQYMLVGDIGIYCSGIEETDVHASISCASLLEKFPRNSQK